MKYTNEKKFFNSVLKCLAFIFIAIVLMICVLGCADKSSSDLPDDNNSGASDSVTDGSDNSGSGNETDDEDDDTIPSDPDTENPNPDTDETPPDISDTKNIFAGMWYGWYIDAFGTYEYSLTVGDDGNIEDCSFYKEQLFGDDSNRAVRLSEYSVEINGHIMTLSDDGNEILFTIDDNKLVTQGFENTQNICLVKSEVISLQDFAENSVGTFIGADSSNEGTEYSYILTVYNDFGIYGEIDINGEIFDLSHFSNGILTISDLSADKNYDLIFDMPTRTFVFEISPAGNTNTKLNFSE